MFELKNPRIAIQLVLIAGIFWSFGAYVVRLIDLPQTVPWQYLFTRGIVIFTLLNFYLYLEEGTEFYKNYKKIIPLKQNNAISTYSPKITKKDGEICFDDALNIWRKYKAFYYWPGIWSDKFKLKKISFIENNSKNNKGEILEIKKESIIVGCTKGSIEIFKIQPHSKKEMDILSYINGKRLGIEDTLL